MKKILTIWFIIFFPMISKGQVQWAEHIWSNNFDGIHRIESDNQNNFYVAQGFRGPKCYFENDSLTATGGGDRFLSKYDSNGNVLWVKQFKSTNSATCLESIPALVVDTLNFSLYVGLAFCGTIILDADTFVASTNIFDYLIVKLNYSGTVLWAKHGFGAGTDVCYSGTVDQSGNSYFYCGSSYNCNFDTINILPGGYLLSLDSQGSLINYKHISGYSDMLIDRPAYTIGALKYSDNNLYGMGGTANDTVTIDSITLQTPDSTGSIFSKFSLSGDVQWIEKVGYPSCNFYSFDFDGVGNFYLYGTLYADSAKFGNQYLSNNGQSDVILLKYNDSFQLDWANQIHASGGAVIGEIEVSDEFGIFVSGTFFTGSAQFGTNSISTSNVEDMFVSRFDTTGACIGVRNFGRSVAGNLAISDQGSVVVGGSFSGPVQIGNNSFSSMGFDDSYLVKYDEITGIGSEERLSNNNLLIFANPNSGKCNITIPDALLNEKDVILSIYDNNGKLIQQSKLIIQEGIIKVNIESEAKGVYNVILSNGTRKYSGKIVFE